MDGLVAFDGWYLNGLAVGHCEEADDDYGERETNVWSHDGFNYKHMIRII